MKIGQSTKTARFQEHRKFDPEACCEMRSGTSTDVLLATAGVVYKFHGTSSTVFLGFRKATRRRPQHRCANKHMVVALGKEYARAEVRHRYQ